MEVMMVMMTKVARQVNKKLVLNQTVNARQRKERHSLYTERSRSMTIKHMG